MNILKLLNQLKRSPIVNVPLSIGAIAGITMVVMPFEANAQQCISPIANLNSSNYVIDTALQGATNPTPTLSFFGGAMQLRATRNGTATWSLGVRVRNDAGVLVGNYLFLQPSNAANYRVTGNSVNYELTFPTPLTSFSMIVAGLNNNDGTTVTAFNGATSIPITAANFTELTPASPPAALGMSVIPPNTVVGSSTLGGTQVDTNSYRVTIPGPVTRVNVVSGKNEVGNNSTVTIGFTTFNICYATLSGTVFEDTNGSQVQNGAEVGTNAGGLNAILVNSSNQVVATTAVAANGTYSFNNVVPGTFTVRITTATATVGAAPPAVTLPTNWVTTGENLNGAIDGAPNSIISVTVTPANITGINLGIEQRPTAVGGTAGSQVNPTGTNTVAVAPTLFTGSTDPNGGTVDSYRITTFPTNATSITINGTNYTSGTFPGGGVTITTAQLAGMLVDPIDGAVTVGIPFVAIDNAGQSSSNTATASLPFTAAPVTITGTVFDDGDGSRLQNGAETGTNAGGINAVLVNSSNQVVASTAVAANGTYTFSNVPANATYTVRITTATATVGAAPPAVTLPANWVTTGENLNSAIDGTVDSILSVPVTTSNVTGVNLGIEQRPTSVGGTAGSQANPTGTNTVTVATTLFTGSTDPDGTVTSYRITAFPTNATSITINGTNYTSGTFPGGGVTITTAQLAGMLVDPIDGAVTVGIPFVAIDNAGQSSSNTATASLPFTVVATTPNLLLVKRLTAINGVAITGFNNDGVPGSADDNPNWPAPATYLQGEVTRNGVRPSDRLEYTIYFLSAGDTDITNVTICDLVPPQTIFVNDAYDIVGGGTGLGIGLANSTTTLPTVPTSYLTSILDSDRGRFLASGITPPTTCKKPITNATLTAADNTDGLVVVDVVKRTTAIVPVPAAEKIPFATGAGVPIASYGFVRFQVTVK